MKPPPRMLEMLLKCRTLARAESELATLGLTRAQSWGLWDGWAGRPKEHSGLSAEGRASRDLVAEGQYDDGYACGAKLKRKDSAS